LTAPGRRAVPGWAAAAAIVCVFFGVYGYAVLTGHWEAKVPQGAYLELIPKANEFSHP
jgi:hypothetical protein